MRLSAHSDSPHYDADLVCRAMVFVDHVELKSCFYADEEAGTASAYKLNAVGRPIIEGDSLVPYEVTGKVEIRIRPA